MNKNLKLAFCATLAALLMSNYVWADEVDLIADPALSSANVELAGSSATTATSGTGVIDLASVTAPFGTAQITDLEIILDDALSFTFLGGVVTASADPGAITVEMLTPGAAGTVNSGVFSQLQNEMAVFGQMQIIDPFNLVGGNQTFNLSSLDSELVDFNNVLIEQSGTTITVTNNYSLSTVLEVGGQNLALELSGTIVANGTSTIPEPGAGLMLAVLPCLVLSRRRRSKS